MEWGGKGKVCCALPNKTGNSNCELLLYFLKPSLDKPLTLTTQNEDKKAMESTKKHLYNIWFNLVQQPCKNIFVMLWWYSVCWLCVRGGSILTDSLLNYNNTVCGVMPEAPWTLLLLFLNQHAQRFIMGVASLWISSLLGHTHTSPGWLEPCHVRLSMPECNWTVPEPTSSSGPGHGSERSH